MEGKFLTLTFLLLPELVQQFVQRREFTFFILTLCNQS